MPHPIAPGLSWSPLTRIGTAPQRTRPGNACGSAVPQGSGKGLSVRRISEVYT